MTEHHFVREPFSTRRWDWELYKRLEKMLRSRVSTRMGQDDPPVLNSRLLTVRGSLLTLR